MAKGKRIFWLFRGSCSPHRNCDGDYGMGALFFLGFVKKCVAKLRNFHDRYAILFMCLS